MKLSVQVSANEEQLRAAFELLEMTMEKWSGSLVDSLSLSYGYVASHDNQSMTIHDISFLADKEMYKAKTAHYAKMGVDRRGQAAAHTALCNLYTKILKIN